MTPGNQEAGGLQRDPGTHADPAINTATGMETIDVEAERVFIEQILTEAYTLARQVGIPETLRESQEVMLQGAIIKQCSEDTTNFETDEEKLAFAYWGNHLFNAGIPRTVGNWLIAETGVMRRNIEEVQDRERKLIAETGVMKSQQPGRVPPPQGSRGNL